MCKFDVFGLSERCLFDVLSSTRAIRFLLTSVEESIFDEQRNLLESLSDSYKGKVICSDDNPDFITGKRGHGGVAIFFETNA